jgi:hypothetical protein
VVAAGELCLVAALGLSLLNGQVVGNRETNLGVSLVINAIAVAKAAGRGANWRQSSRQSSEADECGDCELHLENESWFK